MVACLNAIENAREILALSLCIPFFISFVVSSCLGKDHVCFFSCPIGVGPPQFSISILFLA